MQLLEYIRRPEHRSIGAGGDVSSSLVYVKSECAPCDNTGSLRAELPMRLLRLHFRNLCSCQCRAPYMYVLPDSTPFR